MKWVYRWEKSIGAAVKYDYMITISAVLLSLPSFSLKLYNFYCNFY